MTRSGSIGEPAAATRIGLMMMAKASRANSTRGSIGQEGSAKEWVPRARDAPAGPSLLGGSPGVPDHPDQALERRSAVTVPLKPPHLERYLPLRHF